MHTWLRQRRQAHIALIASGGLIITAVLYGCGNRTEQSAGADLRTIATVSGIPITASELKKEAELVSTDRYAPEEQAMLKRTLLNTMITKKLLLQEARRENLDRDKDFVEEMERYWEQALLKLVIRQKTAELTNAIHVTDQEIRDEYARRSRKIFAELVVLKEKAVAERLSKSAGGFDAAKADVATQITSHKTPEWWVAGDLPRPLEDALFGMPIGSASSPIAYDGQWVVIKSIEEVPTGIAPVDKCAGDIRASIFKRKKEGVLERWMVTLKKNAKVTIDEKALDETKLP